MSRHAIYTARYHLVEWPVQGTKLRFSRPHSPAFVSWSLDPEPFVGVWRIRHDVEVTTSSFRNELVALKEDELEDVSILCSAVKTRLGNRASPGQYEDSNYCHCSPLRMRRYGRAAAFSRFHQSWPRPKIDAPLLQRVASEYVDHRLNLCVCLLPSGSGIAGSSSGSMF